MIFVPLPLARQRFQMQIAESNVTAEAPTGSRKFEVETSTAKI
jgi:hypothetical protein